LVGEEKVEPVEVGDSSILLLWWVNGVQSRWDGFPAILLGEGI
jgi:hypothetical protein